MRKKNNSLLLKKISGGIMIYAIFVSLIIAIILSSMIISAMLFRNQNNTIKLHEQIIFNSISALKLALATPLAFPYSSDTKFILFEDEYDSVSVKKKQWGVYDLLISKAKYKHYSSTKIALVGEYSIKKSNVSLYLPERKKALNLAGNSIVEGTVYLPESGVKRAYVDGIGFSGTNLIHGNVKTSSLQLPELPDIYKSRSSQNLNEYIFTETDITHIDMQRFIRQDSILNSFQNKTIVFYNDESIILKDIYLKGNIIIASNKKITITPSAEINDILISAPFISVTEGFKGKLQLLASDTIVFEKNTKLLFPSSVFVNNTGTSAPQKPFIYIDKDCLIQGIVINYCNKKFEESQATISIAENSTIQGQLYCNGIVDLKGEINGNVICDKFFLRTPNSFYENHLLNAKITIKDLPFEFTGIDFLDLDKLNQQKIVKWLY